MEWSNEKIKAKQLAYYLIPAYFLILGLILSVVFLYIYRFVIDKTEFQDKDLDFEMITIVSDSVGSDVYLGRNANNQTLINIYQDPHSNPYLDISYGFSNVPDGLSFRIIDDNGNIISGSPQTIKNFSNFKEVRYPFTKTDTQKYILQYSLSNNVVNISNVYIQRIEMKISVQT